MERLELLTIIQTAQLEELFICIIGHIITVCAQLRLLANMGMPMKIIRYDRAKPFSFDRAKVFAKGKYGFIDRSGDEVITLVYDKADDFKGNTTEVVLNGEVFIIDINGRIIR